MSGLLLDTHVALWQLAGTHLSGPVLAAVQDPGTTCTSASRRRGRSRSSRARARSRGSREDCLDLLVGEGVDLLAIEPSPVGALRDLPDHHRDPFDRMLVAQAQVERLTLVTRDARLARYDVRVLAA